MLRKQIFQHEIMCAALAGALAAGVPMAAFAEQSPTFAYSEEEWATIRDNELDFDEIDKLIHEYNPTVLKNAMDYQDVIGKKSSDIAQNYYDAAERIIQNMEYPDEDSANFAGGVTAYLNSEISYENLMEQGDRNTNDAETYRLDYAKQEAELVKQAKLQMISYWSQYYSLDTTRSNISTAERNLNSVNLKIVAGTATETARQTAEQSLTTAKTALQTAEVNLNSTRENLLLMLGWDYGSDAAIHELPELSAETVAAIDLAADIETAKANNYTLLSTERQLANAQTQYVRDQLTTTRDTALKKIAENVTALYNTLQQSMTDLAAANDTMSVQASNLGAAERKRAAGMMTEKDYNNAAAAYASAQTQLKTRQIAVLQAYTNYRAAVDGLASTS